MTRGWSGREDDRAVGLGEEVARTGPIPSFDGADKVPDLSLGDPKDKVFTGMPGERLCQDGFFTQWIDGQG